MLRIAAAVRDDVVAHAREGSPEEVCGVLGGVRGSDESTAAVVRRAENAAADPRRRYEMDPTEQLELLSAVEDDGRDVVGFYHSHPRGPPGPSETDARLAAWPGYSYVVVALDGDEATVGSWRWTGAAFDGEDVVVE